MFLEILLIVGIGICLGIITGLIPGIHVNLISVIILSLSVFLLKYLSPLYVCIIIISMAITHSFLDTIPSVFLGVPEEDTALSILPGHRLLLEGRGFEAVMLTVVGSLGGLLVGFMFIPLLLKLVSIIYPLIQNYIGWILLIVSVFMILKDEKKIWALIVFVSSGILGLIVLNSTVDEVLFPLFSGLFGVSMLIMSLQDNVIIPKQEVTNIRAEGKYKAIGCSVLVGWFASFLPGLGPAQAAVIGSQFVKLTEKGFMILVGGLSTVNMLLSLVTFYVLDKARNGAVVTVSKIIEINFYEFLIFITVALIVGGVASILAIKLTKVFSKLISKVNYKKLCISIILLICVMVGIITGWVGLIILVVSTALGIVPAIKGVSRSHMMGCLLIPVMSYFLL
ncbi:tripartite tricarboxylate transporter permease [Candidatus Woesearchaeota archaeon]|nr:tripartite tricarboxylate transporter permease [Candidatus Woesearchaeota archaeon]